MKKSILFLLLVSSFCAMAQTGGDSTEVSTNDNRPRFHQTVKLNLLALFHPSVSYEVGFAYNHAINLTLGGSPKMSSPTHPSNMLFTTLTYRYYLSNQKSYCVFLHAGGAIINTWGTFNIFDHSNGMDIHTREMSDKFI